MLEWYHDRWQGLGQIAIQMPRNVPPDANRSFVLASAGVPEEQAQQILGLPRQPLDSFRGLAYDIINDDPSTAYDCCRDIGPFITHAFAKRIYRLYGERIRARDPKSQFREGTIRTLYSAAAGLSPKETADIFNVTLRKVQSEREALIEEWGAQSIGNAVLIGHLCGALNPRRLQAFAKTPSPLSLPREEKPAFSYLSRASRIQGNCPVLFSEVGVEGNIECMQLDAEKLDSYKPPLVALRQEAFGESKVEAKAWIESTQKQPGFNTFMLLKKNRVIGAQMSYTPSFYELPQSLQSYLANHIHNPHQRTIVYGNSLIIHPDFRGERLAVGLRLISGDYAYERYSFGGALLVSRIKIGNKASEYSARSAGHKPAGALYFPDISHDGWQYWYREVPPIIIRPFSRPFDSGPIQ